MLRIAIADDDPLARQLLTQVVGMTAGAEVVAAVADGDGVPDAVADADVLLLDAWMPGPGLAATAAAARDRRPELHVLLVSGSASVDARTMVERIDALDGWIDKGDVPGLLAALDDLASGAGGG